MKRFSCAILLAAALTGGLSANENIAAGKPLALAAKKKVQEALKLTSGQVAAIEKLYVEAGRDAKTNVAEALAKELEPGQLARLKEISYQILDGAALADPEVQKLLKVSDAQARKLAEVWKNKLEDHRQILGVRRFRNEEVKRRYILGMRKDAGEHMLKVLTEEQAAAFKKMQGASFDLKGLDS